MSDSNEVDFEQLDKDAHARLTPDERSQYEKLTEISGQYETVMATHVVTRAREAYRFVEHANIGPGWMMTRVGNPGLGIVSSFDLTDVVGQEKTPSS